MNSSSMISKICLSLKSLEGVDFNYFATYIQNIELRLDSINIQDIDFEYLTRLFPKVILKIDNYGQFESINFYYDLSQLSNNIIYDIDYYDIMKYTLENNIILDKHHYIISIHNFKYDDIIKYFNLLQNLNNIHIQHYIKIVISDVMMNYNKKLLYDLYKNLINQSNNLICFFEGESFTSTRYHSLILGSPLFYCGLNDSLKTGKGQPTIAEAIRMVKLLGSFCKNIDTK